MVKKIGLKFLSAGGCPINPTYVVKKPSNIFNLDYKKIENLANVRQMSPIAGVNDGVLDLENFDASLVYAPIMGRMSYAGLRWTLGG